MDLISSFSPWVKIQTTGGKICLRCKGKALLVVVNKLLKTKSLLTSPKDVFPLYVKQTFHPIVLNFHCRWSWWDGIQAIFLNLFYFKASLMEIFSKIHEHIFLNFFFICFCTYTVLKSISYLLWKCCNSEYNCWLWNTVHLCAQLEAKPNRFRW